MAAFSPGCSPSASSPRSARTCWCISAYRATRFTMSRAARPRGLGIGRASSDAASIGARLGLLDMLDQPPARLAAIAVLLAGVFLFYPTDYDQPGWRGNFDLSFARNTRIGLRTPMPDRQPTIWRTANSGP